MPPLRRKKPRTKAPSSILFTTAKNTDGKSQLCVYAKCEMSDNKVGPIWGHGSESVRKALAVLTRHCDCPAKFHNAVEYFGKRVKPKKKSKK